MDAHNLLYYLHLYRSTANALKWLILPSEQADLLQGFLAKIFQHAASFYTLSQGTVIDEPPLEVHFWDVPSSYVLLRAGIESYATFRYVFISPRDPDELEFRMCIYRIRGLKTRAKMPTSNPESLAKIAYENQMILDLTARLKATNAYRQLPNNKQQKAAESGEYGISKTQMIANALPVLSRDFVSAAYGFTSDYAHSGYISMFQNVEADTQAKQKEHIEGCVVTFQTILLATVLDLITRYPAIEAANPTIANQVRALPSARQTLHRT